MARFTRWVKSNADGVVALVTALVVGLLGILDILGTTEVSAAILLTLALLATTLLRDRQLAANALRDATTVRVLTGGDVGQALEEARRQTGQWMFKGGTGTYLRAVTLPRCVESARRERRPLRFQIEVVDPSNEEVCSAYTRFRRSLSTRPDGTGEAWTPERTRKESYATVLAACWYLQRFAWLTIEVGLSATMSTFRWDLSSSCVIITQEDPATPALMFEAPGVHYRSYSRELASSLNQSRRLALDRATPLSDEPSVEEARDLFKALDLPLPHAFIDRDVGDIVRKAIQAKNPYW